MLRILFDKNVPYSLRRPSIRPRIAEIAVALKRVSPGSFEFIEIAPPPKRRRLGDPSKHAPKRVL